jgi:serine/threonine protein kinase
VFRAYEPAGTHRDRLVAIKVFRLDLTPEQAKALVDELNALVAAAISHPFIAAPIAAGLEHGTAYLAQEYAVGDSLDVVLREHGPMSITEAVEMVESLAGAIDHAADRGVHHGALHMRDILVAPDAARITGFGITAALTKIGARRPTRPQYSSPDAPSDVYSLGAIAFEAVAGKRVSPENLADFEQRHGVELRGAFGVALAANPNMRPDRAGDFAAVLRDAAEMTAEAEVNSGAVSGTQDVVVPTAAAAMSVAPIAAARADFADEEPDFDLPINQPPDVVADPATVVAEAPEISARAADISGQAADDPVDRFAAVDLPPRSTPAWPPAPPSLSAEVPDEPASRRWPMLVMLLVFVILAGLSVAFFLRSPGATTGDEVENAVSETTVDLSKAVPPSPAPAAAPPVVPAEKTPQPASEPARSAAAPAPAPSRPASGAVRRSQTGNLLLRTTPGDADVTVNGAPRGKTPLVLRDLALGSYTIRIARDGYASEERTFQLTNRRPTFSTTINLRPAAASVSSRGTSTAALGASAGPSGAAEKSGTGGLNVQSRPAGARVFVNNRPAGATPVAVPDVPAGAATVRIEMDGYEPWVATVNVNANQQTRVGASLDRK